MKSLPNAVGQVRSQRRIMQVWLIVGVAFYGIILGQALASARQADSPSFLQSYPTLIVTVVFLWGTAGLLLQSYFARLKP